MDFLADVCEGAKYADIEQEKPSMNKRLYNEDEI